MCKVEIDIIYVNLSARNNSIKGKKEEKKRKHIEISAAIYNGSICEDVVWRYALDLSDNFICGIYFKLINAFQFNLWSKHSNWFIYINIASEWNEFLTVCNSSNEAFCGYNGLHIYMDMYM